MITTNNVRKTVVRPTEEPKPVKKRVLTTSDVHRREEILRNRGMFAKVAGALRNMGIREMLEDGALEKCPRVWIIGGGPSFADFDQKLLEGEVCIGVNRSHELSCVGIAICMDKRFHRWVMEGQYGEIAKERWNNFPGLRIFISSTLGEVADNNENPFYFVRRDLTSGEPSLDNMLNSNNSGAIAIQFAAMLGAKQINLLGFDGKGEDGRQKWWHSGHPNVTSDGVYATMRKDFIAVKEYTDRVGATVTNFNADSAIDQFKKSSVKKAEELLSSKVAKPVVSGFYTTDTDYCGLAKVMEKSARAFGFSTQLYGTQNTGSWENNCLQKPKMIIKALDDNSDRGVLFMDADSVIKKYPYAFDELGDCEFAACIFDWDKVPGSNRKGRELSSAVLYAKDCKNTRDLLERWYEKAMLAITNDTKVWDQKILQEVVYEMIEKRKTFKFKELPMDHDQIFDSMSGLGAPVIVQNQASRTQKGKVGLLGC